MKSLGYIITFVFDFFPIAPYSTIITSVKRMSLISRMEL